MNDKMKIVAVIPARYSSSRLPGKPMIDICGKPMLWWTYHQTKKVKEFAEVYVATDDERIVAMCEQYDMNVYMTGKHERLQSRIWEVSNKVEADYYVCVCGDEPLIEPKSIRTILPDVLIKDEPVMFALMKPIHDPVELMDTANHKVVVNNKNEGILISRMPIPCPYKTVMFEYKKTVGVQCYNKKCLDFFVSTPESALEKIEDIAPLRLIENGVKIKYKCVYEESLSVDTVRDVEKVRKMMEEKLKKNALKGPFQDE